ncbi:unnamed protein product [Orchesella dallaii]|uniref:DNA recombination and repair protein Rad51-like C-terminal domain-containing protein n=1 Tax=Orchesella dallaii TaxID=48710 RepID=A0ABP1RCI1_9HEXA
MASSSRKSSTSTGNASAFDNRRAYKRARYSSSYRQKVKATQQFLGFEEARLKPTLRSFLDIDARFFPIGLHPGTMLEIKGPEKSGKTFLLTYFIARVLTVYPDKKVVLIDTRHKFSFKNYISILCHFDQELKNLQANLDQSISGLPEACPKIRSYLDRLLIFKCYSPEDLLLTVGPSSESTLEKVLLNDPKVCLVAVDSIDNYSYAESLQSVDAHLLPNVMQDLKDSLNKSRCPSICTTLVPVDKREYRRKHVESQSLKRSGFQNQASSNNTNAESTSQCQKMFTGNVQIDYSVFSNILELVPATQAEKDKLAHPIVKNISHYATAYLRSKHSANTAGSGGNHRAKFSIFSDMLWVQES